MPAPSSFDYAVIRVVPRVERGEFINVGVVLYCLSQGFLGARVELDEARLKALDGDADLEEIRGHLSAIPVICQGGKESGPIGRLSQKERWHWLVAPRSTVVQLSQVHSGLADAPPDVALERLMDRMVRRAASR